MSARSGDVTTRKPALSSASFTLLRSDAHTSGAPEQRNTTAALSEIVGAGGGAGCVSRGAAAARGAGEPAGALVERDATATAADGVAFTAAGCAAGDEGFAVTGSFVATAVAGSLAGRAAGSAAGGGAGFAAGDETAAAGLAAGGSACCVAIAGTVFGGSVCAAGVGGAG